MVATALVLGSEEARSCAPHKFLNVLAGRHLAYQSLASTLVDEYDV